jgi:uncharacterized membrane protein
MTDIPPQLPARLDEFARRLTALERELAELRRLAGPQAAPPPIPPPPLVPPAPEHTQPPPSPSPARAARPVADRKPARQFDWSMLVGAKALAWAGGAVTLLGIVFFFVLAVNRGWIGPVTRVLLGSLASIVVFSAGLYIKRRFEELYHSALAAVGTGIAGGYMTLLAATLLYDMVPDWGALVLAAAIAAVGVATALAWSSELIAGLGLIGATLAPGAIGLDTGELSSAGTAFAALVFAGTAIVAIRKQWQTLLIAGLAASLPQVVILVGQAEPTEWNVVAAAAFFWLLYLGAAIGWQERLRTLALATLPASLVILSGIFGAGAAAAQFTGRAEGWILLGVAATYGLVAGILFPARRHRDVSALLGAVALAIAAFAVADLLSGPTLAIAWSAEAAVLVWLARRIDELRYQLAALVYLVAATVHALAFDAPLRQLYEANPSPANGGLALVAVAVAAAIVAWYCRPWETPPSSDGGFASFEPELTAFANSQRLWRSIVGWTGALAALYAASLGALGFAEWVSSRDVDDAFAWGHVGVTGLWGLAALGLLAAGLRFSRLELRLGGLAWLGAVLFETIGYDSVELVGNARGVALLVGAAALLAGAALDRLNAPERPAFPFVACYVVASIAFATGGVFQLVDGETAQQLVLLGVAALYGLLSALVLVRDRDLGTLLWAPALFLAGSASAELLAGAWLVLAWAGAAAGLALLAWWLGEKRFELASAAYLALALGHALSFEAPLGDLFQASRHPESGVPSLIFVIGAAAVFALAVRGEAGPPPRQPGAYDELAYALDLRRPLWRRTAEATTAVLGVYATSLAILGLVEALGGASVTTNFERGHSAVSAFWGLIGLLVLYAGLTRGPTWLRLVGFGLFGLALAKLFLYDLGYLSSITRALSFLAVGAVLLLAGFFVQKLGSERETRGLPS